MQTKEHILSLIRALQEMNLSNAKNVESLLTSPLNQKKQTPAATRRAQQFVLQQRLHLISTLLHHLYSKAENSVVVSDPETPEQPLHSETIHQAITSDTSPTLTITTIDRPRMRDHSATEPVARQGVSATIHNLTALDNPNSENKPAPQTNTSTKQTALLIHNKEHFKEDLIGIVKTGLRMCKKLNFDAEQIVNEALKEFAAEDDDPLPHHNLPGINR